MAAIGGRASQKREEGTSNIDSHPFQRPQARTRRSNGKMLSGLDGRDCRDQSVTPLTSARRSSTLPKELYQLRYANSQVVSGRSTRGGMGIEQANDWALIFNKTKDAQQAEE